jgi:alpha-glucosidase
VPAGEDLIAYIRKAEDRRILVLLNLGAKPRDFDIAELKCSSQLLLSTHLDKSPEALLNSITLRADEGMVIELS